MSARWQKSRRILNLASSLGEVSSDLERGAESSGGQKLRSFFVEQNIRSLDIVIDFDRWFVLFTFFLKRVETDNL